MYPIHIERDYVRFFTRRFQKDLKPVHAKLRGILRRQYRSDAHAVRHDNEEIFRALAKLREELGDRVPAERIRRVIERHFTAVTAWSRDTIDRVLGRVLAELNTERSVAASRAPSGRELTLIPVTSRSLSPLIRAELDQAIAANIRLIKRIDQAHFASVEKVIRDGLLRGESFQSIARGLEHAAGVDLSRARFWAQDQTGKFFASVTRIRQQEAGISRYTWRTMRDDRVRHAHRHLEGSQQDWNQPPAMVRAGKDGVQTLRHAHPGEEPRCRCWAEPLL